MDEIKRGLSDIAALKSRLENKDADSEDVDNELDHNHNRNQYQGPRPRAPPKKKRKRSVIRFAPVRYEDRQRDPGRATAMRELQMYLGYQVKAEKNQELYFDNPLQFWCQPSMEDLYPVLSILAIWCLAIPCSSASVERLFSLASCILSNRRLSMKTKRVEQLVKMKKFSFNISTLAFTNLISFFINTHKCQTQLQAHRPLVRPWQHLQPSQHQQCR